MVDSGTVQIWPGMPVAEALPDRQGSVGGVRLLDQGVDREGNPKPALCRHGYSRRADGGRAMGRWARWAGSWTNASACPKATIISANGRWA
jgi:hypothetical protein